MAAAATRLRLEVVAGRQPSDDLIVDAQLVI
jgi:hypothetical protein